MVGKLGWTVTPLFRTHCERTARRGIGRRSGRIGARRLLGNDKGCAGRCTGFHVVSGEDVGRDHQQAAHVEKMLVVVFFMLLLSCGRRGRCHSSGAAESTVALRNGNTQGGGMIVLGDYRTKHDGFC